MPVFERWLIDSKLEEKTKQQKHMMMSNEQHHHQRHYEASKSKHKKRKLTTTATTTPTQIINYWDPVIPSLPETNDPSFFRLVGELTQYLNNSNNKKNDNNIAQENHKEATKIATELCKLSKEASNEIYSMSQRVGLYQNITSNNNKKKKKKSSGERVNLEYGQNENENDKDKDNRVYSLVYYRKTLKKPFVIKINQSHYTKLWIIIIIIICEKNNNKTNKLNTFFTCWSFHSC